VVANWVEDPVAKRLDAQDAVAALDLQYPRILVVVHPKNQVVVHLALAHRRLPSP
jgi:hypothetical protein